MAIIVQKYGGTSVGDADRIKNVAARIKTYYEQGHDMVVVVSAMGKSTDKLVDLAYSITSKPHKREMDMLLSTGEQVSISLLAMALMELGIPAISFTGMQLHIKTDSNHSNAKIESIDTTRLKKALGEKKVCIVAGFQGIDKDANITTLGRGGSDTSGVALAAVLGAAECEIFTDVDGVFTADPRKVPGARQMDYITYDEMLELARLGSGVLHSRSVEFGKRYNVVIHVRSSMKPGKGTLVISEEELEKKKMEELLVTGVSLKDDEAKISLLDVADEPGTAAELFGELADSNINVDMIAQSVGAGGRNTISFTVPESDVDKTGEICGNFCDKYGGKLEVGAHIAIVSAVGIGMRSHVGVAAKMFRAFADNNINIDMISTSEIKISCVIDQKKGEEALRIIHDIFELDKSPK